MPSPETTIHFFNAREKISGLGMIEESHQGPVTALAAWNGFVWAGTGGFLRKYNLSTGKYLGERRVFKINRVRGIIVDGQGIVCWGGRSYTCRPDFAENNAEDWIISALATESFVYLLTAHNAVLTIDRQSGAILKTRRCKAERSILYSGALYLADDGRFWVAAGTVLGGVVLWDYVLEKVIWRLSDHEGSIFGLAFNSTGTKLASCSDDRSIFIWDLGTGKALSRGWGHVTRIWQLAWTSSNKLVSISEDCSMREWDTATMTQMRSSTGHEGRHVWSLAITPDGIITGGGDSRIIVWDAVDTVLQRREWLPSEISGQRCYVRSCEFTAQGPEVSLSTGENYVLNGDKWKLFNQDALSRLTRTVHSGSHLKGIWYFGHSRLVCKDRLVTVYDAKDEIVLMEQLGVPVTTATLISGIYYVGTRFGDVVRLGGTRVKFGRDAITDIAFHDSRLLLIASRSGKYGFYSYDLCPVAEFRAGHSIEGVNGSICFGFWKDMFIVRDLMNNVELWSENCGGGHRTWAADSRRLMYTRGGGFNLVEIARAPPRILSPGTHGREVRAIASNPMTPEIVVTAGEDTLIGLCHLVDNRLVPQAWLSDHKSAPHALAWHHSGNIFISAGSREELFVWEVSSRSPLLARCFYRLPPSGDADLRITDLALSGDLLAASYSNSTLSIWELTENHELSLKDTFRYTGCCLFTVNFLGDWVLTTASDGFILAWNLRTRVFIQHKAHQSGIRACSVQGTMIWTGGDDNAICVHRFDSESFSRICLVKSAHSSTVTAIQPIATNSAVSTGADQKVRRWLSDGTLIDSDVCDVCDTGVLELASSTLIVGGCGLSFFSIK